MKWINLFEKQPKGEYGTIYSARQIFDKTDVNSYGELCLLEDRMVRYDDEEFQTDWAYAKNYEWLDESEDDLRTKIEALPKWEPWVEITMGTANPIMRKKKYKGKGGYLDREQVLNLLK